MLLARDKLHTPSVSDDRPTGERSRGTDAGRATTTYRLQGIGAEIRITEIPGLLGEAWEIPKSTEVTVHSLAANPRRPEKNIATVSFSSIPESLPSSSGPEWVSTVNEKLVLDTHFRGFTPLHSDTDSECVLDCIAISGLGGHAFGSFKSKNRSFMWLRDALPEDLPQSRIFVYGYDARSVDSKSFQSLTDLGIQFQQAIKQIRPSRQGSIRPLVLIGHSLGGLVVKQAIINMYESQAEDDKVNLQSLRAALFFAVPTLGMKIESIIPMVERKPNEDLVRSLKGTSEALRRQKAPFDLASQSISKYWYYETKESPTARLVGSEWSMTGPDAVLVEPHSATNGCPRSSEHEHHFVEPIDRTHSEIVKFPHGEDSYYETVSGHLRRIKEEIPRSKGRIRIPLTESQSDCVRSLAIEDQESRKRSIDLVLGTCKWIESHPKFQDWEGSRTEILWIRGYPGSGKSSLMKYLADTLDRKTPNFATPTLISFFFHGTGSEIHQSIFGFYSALLNQLLPEIPQFCHAIFDKYTQDRSRFGDKIGWQKKELKEFLSTILLEATSAGISIIILADALDEAGESNATELLDFFRNIENTAKETTDNVDRCLKICFSCRHYPIVMGQNHKFIIDVDDHNEADLSMFVRNKLKLDPSIPMEDNLLTEVQNEIISRTGRTFQWANLMIEEVRSKLTKTGTMLDIQEHISKVPSDLHKLYRQLISPAGLDDGNTKYSPKDQALTLKLFQWLCFSKRPPTLATIQHALVLGPEEPGIARINEHPDFRPLKVMAARVIDLSRGLVEIRAPNAELQSRLISEGKDLAGEDSEKIVQFTHQSVYDFLLETGLADLSGSEIAALEPTARFAKVTVLGHFHISRACIQAMALAETRAFVDTHLPLTQVDEHDFIDHRFSHEMGSFKISECCYSFGLSALLRRDHSGSRLSSRDKKLTTDEISAWIAQPSFRHRQYLLDFAKGLLQHSDQMIPVAKYGSEHLCYHLEAAETFGCDQSDLLELFNVPDLLSTWQGIIRIAWRVNALPYVFWASSITHVFAGSGIASALRLCLKQNPRICSISNDRGETPLHYAIKYGKDNVVKLFVKEPLERRCIYIDQPDSYGSTPLHYAIEFGRTDVAKTLIWEALNNKIVTIDRPNRNGSTPLHCAIEHGRKEIVDTLIQEAQEHGTVNINHLDNEGRSPIFVAANKNRVEDTRLLLSTNMVSTVTQKDLTGDTPLSAAAKFGCTEIASLLLKNGASVESKNNFGSTPLLEAAEWRRDEMVKYLVEKASADVYVSDKRGRLPITYALEALHKGEHRGAFESLKAQMGRNGEALLVQMMKHAQEKVVEYILEHEGPVDLETLEEALREGQKLKRKEMEHIYQRVEHIAARLRERKRKVEEIKQWMEKRRRNKS